MGDTGYITVNMVDGNCITIEHKSKDLFRELHNWQNGEGTEEARIFSIGSSLHSITRAHIVKIAFYSN